MAIVQASLAEEILTRQERAVLRGIYRASQLTEALVMLQKIDMNIDPSHAGSIPVTREVTVRPEKDHVDQLKTYLANCIVAALLNTKVPTASSNVKGIPSTVDPKQ